jgi:hypothetical protein
MIAGRIANMRQGERTDLEPSRNFGKVPQAEAAHALKLRSYPINDANWHLKQRS